ncbi:MAG TPA: DNA internalization-related competence protein ComEC/Rec2 [Bacillaceae bacterium]|nr:DNA internalization-related competence protein ComEC/Rec2 [Bacillaceae bacterium]
MKSGKWYILALGLLASILCVKEYHGLSILFLLCTFFRVLYEKDTILSFLYCAVMLIGLSSIFLTEQRNTTNYHAGQVEAIFTYTEVPTFDGNRMRAIVKSKDEKILLSYTMNSEMEKQVLERFLRAGTICTITGELNKPDRNRNENGFNYSKYLYYNNIHWILQPSELAISSCNNLQKSPIHHLRNMRAKAINFIKQQFPDPLQPYAIALLLGDKSLLSEDTYRYYQKIGVVHLLAISGLHIGLIVGLLYYVFLLIGITKEKIFWFLVVLLPIYAILCGANPPVSRAVLMTLFILSAKKWRIPITTIDALSISFIVFLIWNPYLINNIGFQLSYSVSYSLIISSQRILAGLSYLRLLFNVSVISMLASLPILIYHFYEFSLVSIFTNILYVPFYTTIVLPSIIILFFLSIFSIDLFHFSANVISDLLMLSEKLAKIISSFPFSSIVTGKPSTMSMLLFIIAVILFFVIWENRGSIIIALLPITLLLIMHIIIVQFSPNGEIVFIDVGQGDSILIKLPYNRGTYLIDTGGELRFEEEQWQQRKNPFNVGKNILIPLLKSKGITKIDKLILTHSDVDHMGAATELMTELNVSEILISPNSWKESTMAELLTIISEQETSLLEVTDGYSWNNKSGEFQVLYPLDRNYEGNNDSIVIYGKIGGLNWLFMGDLEKEGEAEIIREYKKMDVNVLKVGHHGSKTSTTAEFIEWLQPDIAIISVGSNNRYGHPHADVIQLLQQNNIKLFRTDKNGGVHYKFKNNNGTFQSILQ